MYLKVGLRVATLNAGYSEKIIGHKEYGGLLGTKQLRRIKLKN